MYLDVGYNGLCKHQEDDGYRTIRNLKSCQAAAELYGILQVYVRRYPRRMPAGCNIYYHRGFSGVVFNKISGSGRRSWTSNPICEQ